MSKIRIAIIGAGFAGISAIKHISKKSNNTEIYLIDQLSSSQFRPLLPDIISGRISWQRLLTPILGLKNKYNFTFICSPAITIDIRNKNILFTDFNLLFDYLIITTGSQTSFPAVDSIMQYAIRLNSVYDAERIRDTIKNKNVRNFIICGGGYTGVEVASNIQQAIKNCQIPKNVIIIEMLDTLVEPLPNWIKKYITNQLTHSNIQILLSTKVEEITENKVRLSNNEIYDNAACVWTTGLKAPKLLQSMETDKSKSGRLLVNSYLMVNDFCFAAGDSASLTNCEDCNKMSVQHSLDQGKLAAENCLALINGSDLRKYQSYNPGFIVPLLHGRACGTVFGHSVKNTTALLFHYIISAYRSEGRLNRISILKAFLKAF
jgi:NADH dehydrogenase